MCCEGGEENRLDLREEEVPGERLGGGPGGRAARKGSRARRQEKARVYGVSSTNHDLLPMALTLHKGEY